jgi:endonuclease/exonuclease/phosphatase family metal-dependent hydrolase
MRCRFAAFLCAASFLIACGDDAGPAAGGGGGGGGSGGAASATTGATSEAATSTSMGSGGAGGGAVADGELVLLTWNIEQFPKAPSTMDLVTGVILERAPDVVALQEIDEEDNTFSLLDTALEDYEGVAAEEGDGFKRVALLYRRDRVALGDVETVFQSSSAFPRPMLKATLRVGGAHSVILGVVHLKAQLDEESTQRRRDACVAIDGWIRDQQAAGVVDPFLIVGDWNDQLTDPPQWNVFGPLLEAADGGFLTHPLEEAGDHTYLPFDSFIDHAMVRGGDGHFERGSAEVLHLEATISGYQSNVSDHIPVEVRLPLGRP